MISDLYKLLKFEETYTPKFHIRIVDTLHDDYAWSTSILKCIEQGEINLLNIFIEEEIRNGLSIRVGVLSNSSLRQLKYSVIILGSSAVRSSIFGGCNPTLAYSLGDKFIRKVDLSDNKDFICNEIIELLITLCKCVNESKNNYIHPKIKKALEFIDFNIYSKISLKTVAAELQITPSYLSKLFCSEVGVPLNIYIKEKKIKESYKLLKDGRFSIAEVSDLLNFSSQSYFSTCFKNVYGKTPSSYLYES